MSNFASGKKSKAISDRSGMAFPTGDTVRFYDGNDFDGITATNINRSTGYTINVSDVDTYTFTVATDTATTGNITGGGFPVYAGPATITP